jgi:uncharacterized protein (DUF1697 family)
VSAAAASPEIESASAAVTKNVALLRAINLAGKRSVSMASLRGLLEDLGFAGVQTLLISGNVVFENDGRKPTELERLLEASTAKRLGVETDYFVRTAKEWSEIVVANPFRREAKQDPGRLIVFCLKKAVTSSDVKALQAAIRGPEIVRAEGRQAYIVYPDGQGRSKLTAALIEAKLGARGTARNWNTVLKVQAMLAPAAAGPRK